MIERGVGIAAADERRDRRRLFRLGAAPAQAPQAAVGAATVAGRGEGTTAVNGKTCYVTQWSFCGDLERERAPGERSYTRSKCTEIKVYMTHEIKVYRE